METYIVQEFLFHSKNCINTFNKIISLPHLQYAQSLDAYQLEQLNFKRRQKLVSHCYEKIPFYKKKFLEIGFEPGDLKSDHEWNFLPILEKEEIREFARDIVDPSFDLKSLPVATTGGTSGLPLKTYGDPRVHLASLSFRMLNWWGLNASENSGYLYRSIPLGISKLAKDIALFPTRRAYISANNMSDIEMGNFVKKLMKIKPRYLVGYVGSIEIFARYCLDNHVVFPDLGAIWTTASPLTTNQRATFEKIFGAPTYTQYGSCEFYWIAAECGERDMLHVGSDVRHVDVVNGCEAVPVGEFGDLVVTDLVNFSFPLLRYRLGDRGRHVKGDCPCGLPFPKMDYVHGRISDNLKLIDGTLVPGEYWTTIFDDFTDSISSFQVRQRANMDIEISFIGLNSAADSDADKVFLRLNSFFQDRVRIIMNKVEHIDQKLGKFQIVINDNINTMR